MRLLALACLNSKQYDTAETVARKAVAIIRQTPAITDVGFRRLCESCLAKILLCNGKTVCAPRNLSLAVLTHPSHLFLLLLLSL
jgi:hypothetical protein